jgi:serine phosphatase RsbU (regulator of sigma subunit)
LISKDDLSTKIDDLLDGKTDNTNDVVDFVLKYSHEHESDIHETLDFIFQYSVEKEKKLHNIIDIILDYSTKISRETDNDSLLLILADFGKTLVESDRATLWLIDREEEVFWTKVGHGIDNIKIPLTAGIIGEVYEQEKTIIVNDPYNYPKFNPAIDKQTNYLTKSILATPIYNKENKMIGIFQAINKLNEQNKFSNEDSQLFNIAISYIANILDVDKLAQENKYFVEEQTKAAMKQQALLVNELEKDEKLDIRVHFKPYDFLSGDSYSLHRFPDGGYLIYVLDAMGHGIVPSLTCVSVLSNVKNALNDRLSFFELAQAFGKGLEFILADDEQLSASFYYIDKDLTYIEWFSAGMYPTIVEDSTGLHSLKANNIPFMNFMFGDIKVDRIDVKDFKKLLVYSDGITEDERFFVHKDEMHTMLDPDLLANYFDVIKDKKMDDDVTALLVMDRGIYGNEA